MPTSRELHIRRVVEGRECWLSIDPAQTTDFSATLVGRLERLSEERKPVLRILGARRTQKVSDPQQCKEIIEMYDTLIRCGASGVTVILDISGVGRPLYDALKAEGLGVHACSAHAGERFWVDGDIYRPGKTALVTTLDAAFASKQLIYDPNAPLIGQLRTEVQNLRGKITKSGNLTIQGRSGKSDDIVRAAAAANFVLCGPAPIYTERSISFFQTLTATRPQGALDPESDDATQRMAGQLAPVEKMQATIPSRWRFRWR